MTRPSEVIGNRHHVSVGLPLQNFAMKAQVRNDNDNSNSAKAMTSIVYQSLTPVVLDKEMKHVSCKPFSLDMLALEREHRYRYAYLVTVQSVITLLKYEYCVGFWPL